MVAIAALGVAACFNEKDPGEDEGASGTTFTTLTTVSGTSTTSAAPECTFDGECPEGYVCYEEKCELDASHCGEFGVSLPVVAPDLVLVLDKSGSMVKNVWDHDGDPNTMPVTRWKSLHAVVEQVVAGFDGSLNLGAVLFPALAATWQYDATACLMADAPDVLVEPLHGQAVLAALPGPDSNESVINGGTPATRGIQLAFDHLSSLDDGLPKFMVMVTDGAANCHEGAVDNFDLFETYDDGLLPLVQSAKAAGVPTFVVGIDIVDAVSQEIQDGSPNGTNTFAKLNELADAGGVPRDDPSERFYNAANQVELAAALTEIAGAVVSCTIVLDPAPIFPNYVEVQVGGVDFGTGTVGECGSEDGWHYVDAEKTMIELCGQACALFKQSGSMNAVYKCPPSG